MTFKQLEVLGGGFTGGFLLQLAYVFHPSFDVMTGIYSMLFMSTLSVAIWATYEAFS